MERNESAQDTIDVSITGRHADREANPLWLRLSVWVARILVGGTFTLSGLTKGIDPWGTFYKIEAYFNAWGWSTDTGALALTVAILLSMVEFTCGMMVLTGCYRRVSVWCALLIMAVMLPLSFWIMVSNPVSDCGCFGDFLVISNTATFVKNLLLGVGCVWLLMRNTRVSPLVNSYLQWIAVTASLAAILCVEWIGYRVQPVVDFRPYKIGTALFGGDSGEGVSGFVFVYSKDGREVEIGETDSIPSEDDGWKFMERRQKESHRQASGIVRPELRIWDEEGVEDMTDEDAPTEGDAIIAIIPKLSDVSVAVSWKLNELYDNARRHDVEMIAVTSATPMDIDEWRDLTLADYPIYTAEDTQLKEIARGNPAIVYLKTGKIEWKTALTAIDSRRIDGRTDDASEESLINLGVDVVPWWQGIGGCYIAVMVVLISATLMRKISFRKC